MLDRPNDDMIVSNEHEPQHLPDMPPALELPQQHQQQQEPIDRAPDPGPSHQATNPSVTPLPELAITCQGTQGLLFLDPAKQNTKPQWLVRCSCLKCQGEAGSPDQGLVMSPSQFERHAGAGSCKKWKSSCRVADPDCDLCGRPVLAWLQHQGYEQTAAAAAGNGAGLSQQKSVLRLQQQQLLLQLKLLIKDMPLLQLQLLPSSIECKADDCDTCSRLDLNTSSWPDVMVPDSCHSPAWQLSSSYYQHLPAAVALHGSAAHSSKGPNPSKTAQTLLHPAATDPPPQSKVHQQRLSLSRQVLGGTTGAKVKRARVLRDGALTVIPYGHDENQLWLQRVHTFIGAVRRVLGSRRCSVVWGGSVLDSVVGAFLTQAVSDVQSSTAFITLAATWPGPATLARTAAAGTAAAGTRRGGAGDGVAAAGAAADGGHDGITPWFRRGSVGVGVDVVDWWSVMNAPQQQLETALHGRGLHVMLSSRIQAFLRQLAADQRCVEDLTPATASNDILIDATAAGAAAAGTDTDAAAAGAATAAAAASTDTDAAAAGAATAAAAAASTDTDAAAAGAATAAAAAAAAMAGRNEVETLHDECQLGIAEAAVAAVAAAAKPTGTSALSTSAATAQPEPAVPAATIAAAAAPAPATCDQPTVLRQLAADQMCVEGLPAAAAAATSTGIDAAAAGAAAPAASVSVITRTFVESQDDQHQRNMFTAAAAAAESTIGELAAATRSAAEPAPVVITERFEKPHKQQQVDKVTGTGKTAGAAIPTPTPALAAAAASQGDCRARLIGKEPPPSPGAAAAVAACKSTAAAAAAGTAAACAAVTLPPPPAAAAAAAVDASDPESPLTPSACAGGSSSIKRSRSSFADHEGGIDCLQQVEQQLPPQLPSTLQQLQYDFGTQYQQQDGPAPAACDRPVAVAAATAATAAQHVLDSSDLAVNAAGGATCGGGGGGGSGGCGFGCCCGGATGGGVVAGQLPGRTTVGQMCHRSFSPRPVDVRDLETLELDAGKITPSATDIAGSSCSGEMGQGRDGGGSAAAAAVGQNDHQNDHRPARKRSLNRELKQLLQDVAATPAAVTVRKGRPNGTKSVAAAAAAAVGGTAATEHDGPGAGILQQQQQQQQSSPPGSPEVVAPSTPQPQQQQQRKLRRHYRSAATKHIVCSPPTATLQPAVDAVAAAAAGGDGDGSGCVILRHQAESSDCSLLQQRAGRPGRHNSSGSSSRSRVILTRSMFDKTTRSSSRRANRHKQQLGHRGVSRTSAAARHTRSSAIKPPSSPAAATAAAAAPNGGCSKKGQSATAARTPPAASISSSTKGLSKRRRMVGCSATGDGSQGQQQQQQQQGHAPQAATKRLKSVRWADEQESSLAAAAADRPQLQVASSAGAKSNAAKLTETLETNNHDAGHQCAVPTVHGKELTDQLAPTTAAAAAAAAGLRRSGRQRTPSRLIAADFLDPSAAVAAAAAAAAADDSDHSTEGDQTRHTADPSTTAVNNSSDSGGDSSSVSSLSSDTTVTSESDVSDDDGANMIADSKQLVVGNKYGGSSNSSKATKLPTPATTHSATVATPRKAATDMAQAAAVAAAASAAVAAVAAAAVTGTSVEPVVHPLRGLQPFKPPTMLPAADRLGTSECCHDSRDGATQPAIGTSAAAAAAAAAATAVRSPTSATPAVCDNKGSNTSTACSDNPDNHQHNQHQQQQQQQQGVVCCVAGAAVPPDLSLDPDSSDAATVCVTTNVTMSVGSPSHLDIDKTQGHDTPMAVDDHTLDNLRSPSSNNNALFPLPASEGMSNQYPNHPNITKQPPQPPVKAASSSSSSSVLYIQAPDITVRTAANSSSSSSSSNSEAPKRLTLEWLRNCSVAEVRDLLGGVVGLGRKSIACVGLLTLGLRDFPVDVNVGRIAARLGWIPLQAEESLESLDMYPAEPEVHKYLLDRLTRVTDMESLYELHYLAITLGKVLCTKQLPHCSACPLQHVCEYALSGGDRLQLGGPRRKARVVRNTAAAAAAGGGGGGYNNMQAGYRSMQAGNLFGRANTNMSEKREITRKGKDSPAAAAAVAWWLDPEIPWTYSSRRSRSDHAAADYDLEDLDALFAAAPRQRRNARMFGSTAASSSSSSRAWGAAAAAAGLLDCDVFTDHVDHASLVTAGTIDPDRSDKQPLRQQQQQQQQHLFPTATQALKSDLNSHQSCWERLFEGLSSSALNNAEQQRQQQQQQQQDGHLLNVHCHAVAGKDLLLAVEESVQRAAVAGVGGADGDAVSPGTTVDRGRALTEESDKRQQQQQQAQGPLIQLQSTLTNAAAAGADPQIALENGQQQQQQQHSTLRQQQQQAIARLASITVPPHCAVFASSSPPAAAAAAATVPIDLAAAADVAGKSNPNTTSSSSSNGWYWEVLGLGNHTPDEQAQQQQQQLSLCAGHDHDVPCESAIKAAYRHLAILLHPDKCQLPGAAAAFALVRRARTLALQQVAAQPSPTPAAAAAAVGGGSSGKAESPQQQQQHTTAAAAVDHTSSAAAAVAAAGSSRTRCVAVALQLTSAVIALLDLPPDYLPPVVPGDNQVPLLLLVDMTQGAAELAAAEQHRMTHDRPLHTQQQQQQQEQEEQEKEATDHLMPSHIPDDNSPRPTQLALNIDTHDFWQQPEQQQQQQQQQEQQQQQTLGHTGISADTSLTSGLLNPKQLAAAEDLVMTDYDEPEDRPCSNSLGPAAADSSVEFSAAAAAATAAAVAAGVSPAAAAAAGSAQAAAAVTWRANEETRVHTSADVEAAAAASGSAVAAVAVTTCVDEETGLQTAPGGEPTTAAASSDGLSLSPTTERGSTIEALGGGITAVTDVAAAAGRLAASKGNDAATAAEGTAVAVAVASAANAEDAARASAVVGHRVKASLSAAAAATVAVIAAAAGGGGSGAGGDCGCSIRQLKEPLEEQLICTEGSTAIMETAAEDLTLVSKQQHQQMPSADDLAHYWSYWQQQQQQMQMQHVQELSGASGAAAAAAESHLAYEQQRLLSGSDHHQQDLAADWHQQQQQHQQSYDMDWQQQWQQQQHWLLGDWQQQQQQIMMTSLRHPGQSAVGPDQILWDWSEHISGALLQQQQQQRRQTAAEVLSSTAPTSAAAGTGWVSSGRRKAKQQQQKQQPDAKPRGAKPRMMQHKVAAAAAKALTPGITALPRSPAAAAASVVGAAAGAAAVSHPPQHITLALPNCKLLKDHAQIAAAVAAAAAAAGARNTSTTSSITNSSSSSSSVCGILLTPVLSALRGAFPLNGTYFQTNELFIDQRSLLAPLLLPDKLLQLIQQQQQQQQQQHEPLPPHEGHHKQPGDASTPAAAAAAVDDSSTFRSKDFEQEGASDAVLQWRHVYLGSSVSSICSGMSCAELAAVFQCGGVCIRSYDPATGAVALRLPAYLTPTGA